MLKFLLALAALPLGAQQYDLVIRNGRVIDPESGLDAVRHVAIRGGKIAAIADRPLEAARSIDASGLIVSPGFIDLHSHGQDEENYRCKAMDGVTSALELEIGALDVSRWYAEREGKLLIHAGVSVGHVPARMKVFRDPNATLVPSGDGAHKAAAPEQITEMRAAIERGLREGALGVGFGIQYTPAATRWEILEMFRVAGRFHAPAFVHMRRMGAAEPSALDGLEELIAASVVTGAPLHVVHITSSSLSSTPQTLQTIAEARARGLDVTTECYPYNAAQTELESAMFEPGWQKILGVDYGALEWVASGERLNAATFASYRKQGGMVIMHMIPDSAVDAAVTAPDVMIASDGILQGGKGHPRASGSYARVLGRFVRERGLLTWSQAIRKMSLLPARRLENYVPAMKDKGRIRIGADADLAIFDPAAVIDRATFREPALYSEGMRYVFVAGVAVVENGKLRDTVKPGRAVRAPQANRGS